MTPCQCDSRWLHLLILRRGLHFGVCELKRLHQLHNPSSSGCCTGQSMPSITSPNNLIAGLWDDLYPPQGGQVLYSTVGTSPNREFIVHFYNIQHYPRGNQVDFQIALMESGMNFEIRHRSILGDGGDHSVGFEDGAGVKGELLYSFTTYSPQDDRTFVVKPVNVTIPTPVPTSLPSSLPTPTPSYSPSSFQH